MEKKACDEHDEHHHRARQAEAGVRQDEIYIDRLTVRAPVDGVVLQNKVRLGQYAQSGPPSEPLMVFGAGKGLHVRASVDENDASRVQAGASAVAHLRGNSQISYPAVVLTTGINDPRVDPWQAAKMAARLQAATSSGKPILLRIDYDAGHGIGSGKAQRIQELADEISFAFWQFGDPQFRAAAWNAPAPNNGHPRGENIRGQIR